MRIVGLVTAVVALFVSGAASAQDWGEYANREDFFQINLPDDPNDHDDAVQDRQGYRADC